MRLYAICIILLVLFGSLVAIPIEDFKLSLSSDYISIYQYKISTFDQPFILLLDEHIYKMQSDLGVYTNDKADIYVIESADAYHALSIGKDRIVEFSDAFYSGREQRIYIRSKEQIHESFLKVLMHEYMHWYLDQIFTNAPLWFHEGMATYHAQQLGYEKYIGFLRDSFWGKKHDLYRLSYSYPQNPQDWQSYYVSSYFALKWMSESHKGQWKHFWDYTAANWRKGYKTDFILAFNRSYLMSLWGFNEGFAKHTRKLSYQYIFIAANSLVLAFIPIVLILAAIKRARKRNNLAEVELIFVESDEPTKEKDCQAEEPAVQD